MPDAASQPEPTRLLRLDRRDAAALLGALIFLLALFGHVLFTNAPEVVGKPDGDGRTQFYIWRLYGFDRIAQGETPLWNPYTFAGMPFVANLQSAVFYPSNWLFLALPPWRAANIGIVLNLFLSLAFTYGWARMVGVGRVGSLVAGAVYALGAPQFLRVYEGHWTHLCAMTWIPWLMACVEALVRKGGRRPVAWGAVGLGLQTFAGQPQYMFYGSIAAVAYFLIRLTMETEVRRDRRALFGRFVGFAAIYVLGMILGAVQMLPSLELLSHSARSGGRLSVDWLAQYSVTPESYLSMLVPWLYGKEPVVTYWGRWNVWETGTYIGVIGLALAVCGVVAGRRRWRWLAFGMTLGLGLIAVGPYTPLRSLLFRLPGFHLFRGIGRFVAPMSLFAGLLAGFGVDALVRNEGRRRRRALICLAALGLALVVAAAATWRPRPRAPAYWLSFMRANLRLPGRLAVYLDPRLPRSPAFQAETWRVAWVSLAQSAALVTALAGAAFLARRRRAWVAAALLALVAVDFWVHDRPYLITFNGARLVVSPKVAEYLRGQGPSRITLGRFYSHGPLDPMAVGVACLEGVEPNVPARYHDIFCKALDMPLSEQKTSLCAARPSQGLELLRLLNWRFIVDRVSAPIIDIPGAREVFRDAEVGERVTELPGWLPRARLVHHVRVVEPPQVLDTLLRARYRRAAVMDSPPDFPLAEPTTREAWPEFLQYEPERVVVRVRAKAPGLLVLSDMLYPGWQARVDGRRVRLRRVDYLLRGVPVDKGEHTVEFVYRPLSFDIGMIVSIAGGWVAVGMLVPLKRRRRGRERKKG